MQELFEGLLRIIGEIVFEVLLKGPGYLILKLLRPGSVSESDSVLDEPDGCLVLLSWNCVLVGHYRNSLVLRRMSTTGGLPPFCYFSLVSFRKIGVIDVRTETHLAVDDDCLCAAR